MVELHLNEVRRRGGISTIRKGIPDDLFMVCASFEHRTTSAIECLSEDYRAKKGIIYYNQEFVSNLKTSKNLERLKALLRLRCNGVDVREGSLVLPEKQFAVLKDAVLSLSPASIKAITIDVTTFNREALLVLMALLRNNCALARIRVLYVSPIRHGKWLSRGFREVRSVIGFPGVQRARRSTMLVVLSGFEPDRVKKLIEEHEPRIVLLGFGDPPTERHFLERNIEEQKTVLAKQDVERFRFPANNIKKCHQSCMKLLRSHLSDYNIILAPMSTKLSTLGAYLTAEANPEIQLTYCVPGEYNVENYSKGTNLLFVEEIPPLT